MAGFMSNLQGGLFSATGAVAGTPLTDQQKSDAVSQAHANTNTGANNSLVTTPSIRTGQSALQPGDPGYGTAQSYYNPMADATAAANQYAPQLSALAGQSAQAGQNAQTNLNLTGSAVNNYALQQGGALSQVGGTVGGNLTAQGQAITAQGAAAAGRNVANPNYALMNNSIAQATNPAMNLQQNQALGVAQPNYGQANQSIVNARPNMAMVDSALSQATPNFNAMNQSLNQATPNFAQTNQTLMHAQPNFNAANGSMAGANMDFGGANNALGTSQNYAGQLTGIEAQPGPSGAQAQLQSGLNQSNENALALARSGRGFGGNAAAMNQAAGIRAQASQQAVNSAAMLKAQETAAERQRAAQNLTSAAGIQQGAAGQMANQQSAAAQLGMQKAGLQSQNATTSGQMALQQAQTLQAQQEMGVNAALQRSGQQFNQQQLGAQTALQSANTQLGAQQLGSQVALQSAGLQQQQQDAATQAALARAAQYGQQAQFLSGQQMAGAGLELNQQQLSTQAALQQQQQNDAATASLYGLGLGAENQGGTLAMQGLQSGAQLGLAGYGQAASDQTAAGQLGLAGLNQSGAQLGAAYGVQANAIDQQQAFNNALNQRYATQVGNSTQSAALSAQEHQAAQAAGRAWFDSGVSGVSSLMSSVGGGAAMSDRNAKENIKPANGELLVPSIDQPGGVPSSYNPYSQDNLVAAAGGYQPQSGGVSGLASAASTIPQAQAQVPQSQVQAPPTMQSGSSKNPSATLAAKDYQQSFTPQQALAMSDEREKEAVHAISNTPGYSFNYKDPDQFGATEGRQYGIMAQDLEKTPAGRSVVKPGPEGAKMVDTSRLTMVNTAALNGMQKQIDRLNSIIARGKKAA